MHCISPSTATDANEPVVTSWFLVNVSRMREISVKKLDGSRPGMTSPFLKVLLEMNSSRGECVPSGTLRGDHVLRNRLVKVEPRMNRSLKHKCSRAIVRNAIIKGYH